MADKKVKAVEDFEGEVIATAMGYYEDKIREEGEHFHFKGMPGRWMKPAEGGEFDFTAEDKKIEAEAKEEKALESASLKIASKKLKDL